MRRSSVLLTLGLGMAIAGLPLTGCTGIGYVIGTLVDQNNLVPGAPVPSLTEMEDGDLYRVVKVDSSVVIGRYIDTSSPGQTEVENPYDEVQESYNLWRQADSSRRNMPRCLDSVGITLDTRVPSYLRGRLIRMSADSLWLIGYGGPRMPTQGISLHQVRRLRSTTGGQIEGEDLREKAAGMVLPLPTSLPPRKIHPTRPLPSTVVLMVDWSEYALPVDSIAYVSSMDTPSSARWTGMIVGVCVDVAVIVTAAVVLLVSMGLGSH